MNTLTQTIAWLSAVVLIAMVLPQDLPDATAAETGPLESGWTAEPDAGFDVRAFQESASELFEHDPTSPQSALAGDRWRQQIGEDVGVDSCAWQQQVFKQMQTARARILQRDRAGPATNAQLQVLASLDEVIAQLSRQCSGASNCQKSATAGDCKPGPPKPGGSAKGGSSPGTSPGKAKPLEVPLADEKAKLSSFVKGLWGSLPERDREQILQPLGESFLPKYAEEIEAYFRALAEPDSSPAPAP